MASRRKRGTVALRPWLWLGLPSLVVTMAYGGVTELRQFGDVRNLELVLAPIGRMSAFTKSGRSNIWEMGNLTGCAAISGHRGTHRLACQNVVPQLFLVEQIEQFSSLVAKLNSIKLQCSRIGDFYVCSRRQVGVRLQ
jgi:hypothetical protein